MKAIAFLSAGAFILLGLLSLSVPNANEKAAAPFLLGFGLLLLIVAFLASKVFLKWFLGGLLLLVVVAYSLPMSFWQLVGLAEKPEGE